MKKLLTNFLTTALVLCCLSGISAQRFGVKAGLNLATFTGDVDDASMLPTFHVGGLAEFDFTENMGVGVGVQLSGKGAKFTGGGDDVKFNPMYLQVPIQLHYRSNGFYAGVGPFVGFGIGGKIKAGDEKTDIEFGSDGNLSALDFGAGIELGYEFAGCVRASASYNLGLANVIPSDFRENDESAKNNVISVSLAYLFGNSLGEN